MTDSSLFRRSRGALAIAGLVAMALATLMQGSGAQAAARPIAEPAAAR